jgi:hypothetical protein
VSGGLPTGVASLAGGLDRGDVAGFGVGTAGMRLRTLP